MDQEVVVDAYRVSFDMLLGEDLPAGYQICVCHISLGLAHFLFIVRYLYLKNDDPGLSLNKP